MRPSLSLIIGPMFAGKSTQLLKYLQHYLSLGRSCFAITSVKDMRKGANGRRIQTHNGINMEAHGVGDKDLMNVLDEAKRHDCIFIDEAHFFHDLEAFVGALMMIEGKRIVVAGLDSDFNRRSFENVINLIPIAKDVNELVAVCNLCKGPACLTRKIKILGCDMKERFQVGGSEAYEPVCSKCY